MKWPEEIEVYSKHFSESDFWKKIKKHSRKLGAKTVYYALVLYYAWGSGTLSNKEKAIILGALGYLILPTDLIPDFIPFTGFSDDLVALTLAVVKVMKNITPEVKTLAEQKVREIFGEDTDLEETIIDDQTDVDEQ